MHKQALKTLQNGNENLYAASDESLCTKEQVKFPNDLKPVLTEGL